MPYDRNGSSPCIRGTLGSPIAVRYPSRFIPVHTGNAGIKLVARFSLAVHPRAYGERWNKAGGKVLAGGSSPCIRGTLREGSLSAGQSRFIPVHTGNANLCRSKRQWNAVHPRAYGERRIEDLDTIINYGSSPCIRGTRGHALMAGRGLTVHPRAYGERPVSEVESPVDQGSSPCIRETLKARDYKDATDRFIPVHTGNAPAPDVSHHRQPVHPRAYGERDPV